MKQQINIINVSGALISAGLLVFSHFLPVQNASSKAPKLVAPQISKNIGLTSTSLGSQNNIKIQMPTAVITTKIQTPGCKKVGKSPLSTPVSRIQKLKPESLQSTSVIKTQIPELESPQPITLLKTQTPEPVSVQLTDKSPQLPSKSNGCPKNLDYFTQKPRPKQTPEECITCKNLITCVCLTSS